MTVSPLSLRIRTRRTHRVRRRRALVVAFLVTTGAAVLATIAGHRSPVIAQAPRIVRALDVRLADTYGHGFARIAGDGSRVFALEGDRVAAFDFADPNDPRPLGRTTRLADPTLIGADDGLIAVVVRPAGRSAAPSLSLFDGRVGAPTATGTVALGACQAANLAVADGWIAVACGADGVRIVDGRAPDRPVVVTTLLDTGSASAVALYGRRLLVGGAAGDDAGFVALYDTADPGRPVPLSDARWPAPAAAVGLGAGRALIGSRDTHGLTRLAVVDLDRAGGSPRPWTVRSERTFDGVFGGPRIASNGIHAFASFPVWIRGESKVLDVDLSRPEAPWAQELHFAWGAVDVAPLADGLVIDDAYRGLVGYGRGGDAKLAEQAIVPTISSPYGAATDGTHLYVADDDDELWALDVSDPTAMRVVARSALGPPLRDWVFPTFGGGLALGASRAVAVRGPAFSSYGDVGLVDLADPQRPHPIGRWVAESDPGISRAPKGTYDFATASRYDPIDLGELVLVPSRDAGVTVLDVRDPAAPTFASVLARQGGCGSWSGGAWVMGDCDVRGIAAADRTVYVASSEADVLMYTLQDDGTATAAGAIDVPGDAYDVAVVGDALLVAVAWAGERSGVRVIDRKTLRSVRSVEGFAALRLRVQDDTAFVVGWDPGANVVGSRDALWAIDVVDPFAPVVRARIPLPASLDPFLRPAHVARIGDVLAVVAAVDDADGPTILLYRLSDGEPLPADAPGPTLTPCPTRTPSSSPVPGGPTSAVQPLPTATPRPTSVPPPVAPEQGPLYLPFAAASVAQRGDSTAAAPAARADVDDGFDDVRRSAVGVRSVDRARSVTGAGSDDGARAAALAQLAPAAAAPAHFALLDAWSGAYTGVAADGPRFYASRGQRLEVWDASDPDHPVRLGTSDRLGSLASVRAAGGGWAVVEVADDAGWTATPMSAHRLVLVDVRDGAQPAPPADLPVPLALRDGYGAVREQAFDVAVAGGHIYAVSFDGLKLFVLDVANGTGPRLRATLTLPAIPTALAAGAGWLAVGYPYAIDVYGLSPSSAPVFRRRHVVDVDEPSMERLTAIAADGDRLVVAAGGWLRTLRVSDTGWLDEIGRVDACGSRVQIVSVASDSSQSTAACSRWREPGYEVGAFRTAPDAAPVNIPLESGWAWDMGPHGLALSGDVLAAAAEEGGLTFYRAVDGAWTPRHHERTLGNPSALSFDGSRLWATDFDDELWAIDLTDPARPRLESVTDEALRGGYGGRWSSGPMSSFTSALLVDRGMAYVGHRGSRASSGSWSLVDVRDPLRPVAAGEWAPVRPDGLEPYHPTSDYAPVRVGDRILVSGYGLGLAVLDATDPLRPRQAAGRYSEGGFAGGIAADADGRTAWVALGADGLGIFDVDGDTLRDTGRVTGLAEAVDVVLGGGRAYVGSLVRVGDVGGHTGALERGGLSVIDSAARRVIARLPGPDVLRVALAGPTTLVTLERAADGWTEAAMRLRAYDVADPTAPSARGATVLPAGWSDPLAPMAVADDIVIAGAGPSGLLVYRLTDGPGDGAAREAGRAYLPMGIVRR